MTSLNFRTAVKRYKAKLSSFVQFENEMASFRIYAIYEQGTTSYVLTVSEHKVEPYLSEPRFKRTSRLFKLNKIALKFGYFYLRNSHGLTEPRIDRIPAISNQISRPAEEKALINRAFQLTESENVEKQ